MRTTRRPIVYIASFCLVVGSAVWLPDLQLNAELTRARREGLWASTDEMARDQKKVAIADNAMPLIDHLYDEEAARRKTSGILDTGTFRNAVLHLVGGTATSEERQHAKAWHDCAADLDAEWREASRKPALDSGTDWSKGTSRIWNIHKLRVGQNRLLTAAALGIDVRENLIAAARLGGMFRHEPGLVTQCLSVRFTHDILRIAKIHGIETDVEKAMGPHAQLKLAYRGMMADMLAQMEEVRTPEYREKRWIRKATLDERIQQLAPFAAANKVRLVQGWRSLWKQLPKDSDFESAARHVDRELPRLIASIEGYSHDLDESWKFTYGKPGDALRLLGKAEAERWALIK